VTDFRAYDAIIASGQFILNKFTRQCKTSSVRRATLNLRKQGFPVATVATLARALPKR
jgi:hypothetical protein